MVAWVIDPFFSAKLRIERAKEHLDTLDTEFDRFFDKIRVNTSPSLMLMESTSFIRSNSENASPLSGV